MSINKALALLTVVSLPLTLGTTGCTTLECGEGTSEVDGVCAVDDATTIDTPSNCGQDTSYDPVSMTCVPDFPPTECDQSTSVAVPDPVTGVITCVGIGGGGCDGTFLCQSPVEGKVSVCGQLYNVADNTYLRDSSADGTLCADKTDPDPDGPCSTVMSFYDAVEFATSPDTAVPLAAGRIQIDDCGRFRGESIDFPTQAPFVGISLDNNTGSTQWARTGNAVEVSPNLLETGTRSYAVSLATIDDWTTSANDAALGGQTFWERGVYIPLFMGGEPELDADDPGNNVHKRIAGATITSAGSPAATRDWYFSDADPNNVTTVDSGLGVTGVNGAGLMIDSTLVMHSGSGAEPAGCRWPSNLADAIPTVAFIQERIAEDNATGDPCE